MKKFAVLSLVGLFVLAFGTAYAQEKEPVLDFKASGFIQAISFYTLNDPGLNAAAKIWGAPSAYGTPDVSAYDRKVSYLDSRAHLKFNAAMGKELSGTIYFEIDSTRWGDTPGGQGGKLSERGTFGYWSGDRAAVEVKNIYFDVGLPYIGIPFPMTARVGLQPLNIRPWIFVYTDGMGVSGGIKIDPIMIQPMWFKALEGVDWTADDVDIYGLHVNAKVASFTIGGYGINYNMNTYPFFVSTTQTLTDSNGDTVDLPSSLNKLVQGTNQANMWWLGLYADGKAGPVNLNFDFVYDTGKVDSRTAGVKDVDYKGWATRLKVDFPWEKFNFGVVGLYGTGADKHKTNSDGLPGANAITGLPNDEVKSFVVPVGSENGAISGESVLLSWYAGSTGGVGWASNHNYNQMCRGSSGGIWFAKGYAGFKVAPWYKVTLQGLYIGDTTKHGNTFGNAVKITGDLRDDKDIGIELDLVNDLQIYKNLKWEIAGGMLFAGDAMDFYDSSIGLNDSPKNPWAIVTRLTYSF